MNRVLVLLMISAFATVVHAAASVVNCEDAQKSVRLTLTFAKKDSTAIPTKASITSNGKTKGIDTKQISKFTRNTKDFNVSFKVQTKAGLHDLELVTLFNKNPKAQRTSYGTMTNKTQDERVNVTCWF